MKGKLEFDLPEETNEFKMASHAADLYLGLSDIDNFIRSEIKYQEHTEEEIRLLEKIRELIPDEYRLLQ